MKLSPYYFRLILCLSFKFKTKYSVYYEKDLTFSVRCIILLVSRSRGYSANKEELL